MTVEFLDNGYWENEEKTILKCIRLSPIPSGGRKKDVLELRKILPDGRECDQFKAVIAQWGMDKIDANTQERKDKKEKEDREKRAIHEQRKKSHELEQLFNAKLQAFEIDTIKNSTNRELRSRLRRAKNVIEMNALAALVIGTELGYFKKADEDERTD